MNVVLKGRLMTLSATNATYHLLFITFAIEVFPEITFAMPLEISQVLELSVINESKKKCIQRCIKLLWDHLWSVLVEEALFLKAKRYLLSFGLPLCPWEDLLSCVDQKMTTTNVTHNTMDSDSDGGEDLQVSTLDPKVTTSYKHGSTAVVRRDSSGYYSDTQKRSPRYRVNQTQSHLWLLRNLDCLLKGHCSTSFYLPLQFSTLNFGLIPGLPNS